MKKAFLTLLSLTAATLLLLLTPSCSGLVSPTVPDSDSESTPNAESQRYTLSGSFSMPSADAAPQEISALSSPQRNAIPDTSSLTYTVEAKRSDGYTETTASDGSTYTFTNLTAGTWQITAYASTTGGTRVMQSETKSVTLSSTRPDANASLELTPSSGTGDIDIQVNWAPDSKIGYFSWAFSGITNSGNNTNSSFNITAESIPSGTYALTLDFYTSNTNATNGAKPIYSCTEYVSVYAGLTTNSWTASTAPHIGSDGSFSVTKECVETFVYRKIYVKQGADDSTATGTSERPFPTIEKAMTRLKEVASNEIRSGQITATTPWELHVSGTITATAITGSEGALIEVDEDIKCLAIIGEGSGATIDANALGTVVHVGGGGGVSMENVTLQNGSSTKGGGVYIDDGTFTMQSGSITGNTATQEGGGVYVADGSQEFIMKGGTISGNTASSNGGGVYCNGLFTMYDGTISSNSAMNGKGVYIESNGVFTMLDGTITANTGNMGAGGGVYNCNTFNMYDGTISANGATAGNGVYVADGTFTMYNGSISANTGSSDSGAVSVSTGAEFTMEDGTISGNLITGGVNISGSGTSGGTFTMNGGTISGNTAYYGGGGVYVGNGATFDMTDGTIKGNSAEKGGGVYSAGNFTMSGGTIGGTNAEDANKAQGSYKQGGGVYVNMNTFEMTGGTIEGNTVDAGGQGTGVYVENNTTILFSMKENARVAPSNDVYLYNSKITIAGQITATSPVATITPADYATTTTVLDGSKLTDYYHVFAVTPKPTGGSTSEAWFTAKNGIIYNLYPITSLKDENYEAITKIGISDADDMDKLSQLTAAGKDFSGKTIELQSNITLNNTYTQATTFKGTFDGKTKTIYGLNGQPALFGTLENGTIKDLTVEGNTTRAGFVTLLSNGGLIEGCTNKVSVSGTVTDVGGIAGWMNGTSTIRKCVNQGSITSSDGYLGGITGRQNSNGCIIDSCVNKGTVTYTGSNYFFVAGIVGDSFGFVINCINTGSITGGTATEVGGIAGNTYTSGSKGIINCANTGNVSGQRGQVGGITGTCDLSGTLGYNAVVKNCFNAGPVTASSGTRGGIVGEILTGGSGTCTFTSNHYKSGTAPSGVSGKSDTDSNSTCDIPAPDQMNVWVNANNSGNLYKTWTAVSGNSVPNLGFTW